MGKVMGRGMLDESNAVPHRLLDNGMSGLGRHEVQCNYSLI